MKESVLRDKSGKFADRIAKLYRYLTDTKKEFIFSKQIARCGTSIGANVAEAGFAASKKDFVCKLKIAQKECNETMYWLERLNAGSFITEKEFNSMKNDCDEIGKMLTTSVRTATLKPAPANKLNTNN